MKRLFAGVKGFYSSAPKNPGCKLVAVIAGSVLLLFGVALAVKATSPSGGPGQNPQEFPADLTPIPTNQIPFNGVLWSMAQ